MSTYGEAPAVLLAPTEAEKQLSSCESIAHPAAPSSIFDLLDRIEDNLDEALDLLGGDR